MALERHPWNRSFAWISPNRPLRRISPAQVEQFDALGYCVLENAIAPDTLAAVIAAIDPLDQQSLAFLRTQPDERFFISDTRSITFSVHLVTRSPPLREFCRGQLFQDLAWDLIGRNVRLYWDQAVYKRTERPRPFPWHQDNGYTYVQPQQYLTCWIALTDATAANGCPWVVPGLHRMGTLRHWVTDAGLQCLEDATDAVAVPARAGSVVVFSSLTPHATGPNESAAVRKTYIVQLAPEWARALRGDPDGGEPTIEVQNDPDRQFPILRGGRAVDASAAR